MEDKFVEKMKSAGGAIDPDLEAESERKRRCAMREEKCQRRKQSGYFHNTGKYKGKR